MADEVVANCVSCIVAWRKHGKQEGFFHPIDKTDVPFNTLHIDHLGPLPSTAKSYNYLFVVVDAFSKFTWLYPVKSTSAEEVIRKLELQSEVFGNPRRIVSDRDTAFTSNAFNEYCSARKISHVAITTGIPRGNGQVERVNQVIISILSKLSASESQKWYKYVPRIQKVINSTKSRSTNRTPFELIVGVPMYREDDIELTKLLEEELVLDFDKSRQEMRNEARAAIQKLQEESRKVYNRKRKPARQCKVHDLVAIKRTQFGAGLKLFLKFLGPYEVIEVNGKDRYNVPKIGNHEGSNTTSTSADFMKPWTCSDDEEDESESDDRAEDGSPGAGEDQDVQCVKGYIR